MKRAEDILTKQQPITLYVIHYYSHKKSRDLQRDFVDVNTELGIHFVL